MGKELGKYLPVARYWMRAPCRLANTSTLREYVDNTSTSIPSQSYGTGTGTARKKEKKAVPVP